MWNNGFLVNMDPSLRGSHNLATFITLIGRVLSENRNLSKNEFVFFLMSMGPLHWDQCHNYHDIQQFIFLSNQERISNKKNLLCVTYQYKKSSTSHPDSLISSLQDWISLGWYTCFRHAEWCQTPKTKYRVTDDLNVPGARGYTSGLHTRRLHFLWNIRSPPRPSPSKLYPGTPKGCKMVLSEKWGQWRGSLLLVRQCKPRLVSMSGRLEHSSKGPSAHDTKQQTSGTIQRHPWEGLLCHRQWLGIHLEGSSGNCNWQHR